MNKIMLSNILIIYLPFFIIYLWRNRCAILGNM